MVFLNNRTAHHTTGYLRWVIAVAREYPGWRPLAERAAVELVRRNAL